MPGDKSDHVDLAIASSAQCLESDVPLSASIIWSLQQDYYAQRGVKAWTEDLVPSFITSNPFIAEIYAQIIAAFLDDCIRHARDNASSISTENPLRILELGAGTGKFSHLFLRHIVHLLDKKGLSPKIISYCMSDCSEGLLEEWRGNHKLAEFVSAGILEFHLLRAGEEQQRQKIKGPLVVIGNYVFDSLPQDAFTISAGRISEALITTTRATEESDVHSFSNLQFSFKNIPVLPDRYRQKTWNTILEQYGAQVPHATVLFPVAALNLVQQLGDLCDGDMLMLAADKGILREDYLPLLQGMPAFEFHAGNRCFSQLVNFDAIAKYFIAQGGEALLPEKHFSNLSVCAFLAGRSGDKCATTRRVYEQTIATFGPDDLFALMSWLNAHLDEVSIAQALALLRLTRWDTTAFFQLFPALARQARNAAVERHDLRDAIQKVWINHYPVTRDENVLAFNCGVLLLELRFFADALDMFKASEQVFGGSVATSYNLGLCYMGLGNPLEALLYMQEACEQDPSFGPAQAALIKLKSEHAPA